MTKVMLIKPAYETDAVWDTIRTSQPLGLWWMGSALLEAGHEVRLLDETVRDGGLEEQMLFTRIIEEGKVVDQVSDVPYADFLERKMGDFNSMGPHDFVNKYTPFQKNKLVRNMVRTGKSTHATLQEIGVTNPDLVGIPIFASCNYDAAIGLAKEVKENFPSTRIVLGGQHVTALFKEVIDLPYIDHVVVGDAVTAIGDLASGRTNSEITFGGVQDILSFPLLDSALIHENQYPINPTHTCGTSGRLAVDYMFSKGCFRACEFCVAGEKENKISTTELDKIDAQLGSFVEMGIEEIVVQDDAFLFKPQSNLREYLALMKNHGLYWQDNGGIEFEGLTAPVMEMFLKYQSAGEGKINALYVPLNPRAGHQTESSIRDMTKRFAQNFPHIKQLRDSGIYVYTSEIIGYPGKSLQLMEEDIELHQQLVVQGYVEKSMTFVTSTLPGTKLYREHHQRIFNKTDWAAYSIYVPQSTTEQASIREIEEMTVRRNQEMNKVQDSQPWGSSFPNC